MDSLDSRWTATWGYGFIGIVKMLGGFPGVIHSTSCCWTPLRHWSRDDSQRS
jgi:hypothetical protein